MPMFESIGERGGGVNQLAKSLERRAESREKKQEEKRPN
jgi:hypothetical protein